MLVNRYRKTLEHIRFVLKPSIAAGTAFLQGFNINRTVEITGHRGCKVRAPENTLSALRQAFPELTTGFIVFKVAGNLSRMEADFLSINAARATPRLVRQLHRQGRTVHVWTVNDFNNVISMVERGVDNIITDYPRDVRRFIQEWQALSDSERIVLMLRNLIVGIESPEPSDL